MRIAVVGAGAMGAIFGARFAQAGHDTHLVDVAVPLVDKINSDGITVVRGDDATVTQVPATTDPASVGPVDLVVSASSATTPLPPPRLRARSSTPAPSSPHFRTAGETATSSPESSHPSRSSSVSPTTAERSWTSVALRTLV